VILDESKDYGLSVRYSISVVNPDLSEVANDTVLLSARWHTAWNYYVTHVGLTSLFVLVSKQVRTVYILLTFLFALSDKLIGAY
jgi:hypothetical protein